jgi:glucuronate isomerase
MPIRFSIARRGVLPTEGQQENVSETTDLESLRVLLESPQTTDAIEFQSSSGRLPSVLPKAELMAALSTLQRVMVHELEKGNALPRTILMSLNPEAHASLAVLAGSFVREGVPGYVQLGPAWWWCDHEEGMRDVLEKNAAYGVLSTFVGMTTDSRSLLSFVRHDYFRRVLCKWIAEKVASGAFPGDESLLRPLLENICYKNAKGMVS